MKDISSLCSDCFALSKDTSSVKRLINATNHDANRLIIKRELQAIRLRDEQGCSICMLLNKRFAKFEDPNIDRSLGQWTFDSAQKYVDILFRGTKAIRQYDARQDHVDLAFDGYEGVKRILEQLPSLLSRRDQHDIDHLSMSVSNREINMDLPPEWQDFNDSEEVSRGFNRILGPKNDEVMMAGNRFNPVTPQCRLLRDFERRHW